MHVDLFILVITCLVNLLLGLIVLLRDAKRLYATSFATMSLFISIWIVANFVTNHYIDDVAITNIANKLTYVFGVLSVTALLVLHYTVPYSRHVSLTESSIVLILLASTVLLSLYSNVISGRVLLD